jgi:hypothetical protein
MEITKLALEYLRAILVWPLVAALALWFFRKEVCMLLVRLADVIDRIKKADFAGVSLELSELASQATPKVARSEQAPDLELSASTGGYSTDYHAIIVVLGIANRGEKPDQVVAWKLTFDSQHLELEPGPAPANVRSTPAWWRPPTVEIPPNRFIQGTLFFHGRDALQEDLPREPLLGRLTARTLHGKDLASDLRVYRLSTLRENPSLDR